MLAPEGAVQEYATQVITNFAEGKDWKQALTDVDGKAIVTAAVVDGLTLGVGTLITKGKTVVKVANAITKAAKTEKAVVKATKVTTVTKQVSKVEKNVVKVEKKISKTELEPLSKRAPLRKSTKDAVKEAAPKTKDGRYIDPNTRKPIDKGQEVFGHKTGKEWSKYKKDPVNQGKSRKEVLDDQNDPKIYQIEDKKSNASHKFEEKVKKP